MVYFVSVCVPMCVCVCACLAACMVCMFHMCDLHAYIHLGRKCYSNYHYALLLVKLKQN